MTKKHETDVLIVGAGPVGLVSALSLARKGVRVRIVDEEFRTAAHSYALALHPQSLHLLDDFGLADELISRGHRVETVAFYEGAERRGEMKLAAIGGRYPYVLALPQSVLESLLEQRLRKEGVKVDWNCRVSGLEVGDPQATARIDHLTKAPCGYAVATTEWIIDRSDKTAAAFVIGADGHRSVVRRTLGIEYVAAGGGTSYAVFEFHTDADLGGEVRIVFADDTVNVLWPMPGGRCRWSLQLEGTEITAESRLKQRLTVPIGRQAYPHLSAKDLHVLIQERAPWFEGQIGRIDWSMEVRFDFRLADSFGRDRCWLAGDAAHLAGPVGGQSLNMGLREGADLAGCIAEILRGGGSMDSLADYNQRWMTPWRQLLALDGGLVPTGRAEPWAKALSNRILPCIPATGDDLSTLAAQLGLELGPAA